MISNVRKYYCNKLIEALCICEAVASSLGNPLFLIHFLIHPQQVSNKICDLIFCDMTPSHSSYNYEDYED